MPDRREWPALPGTVRWAIDLVTAPGPAACRRWPGRWTGWPWCDDLDTAIAVVDGYPDVRAVTRDGDLIGPDWALGGTAGNQSLLEIQAAVDAAGDRLQRVREQIAELDAALSGARAEADRRELEAAGALAALHAVRRPDVRGGRGTGPVRRDGQVRPRRGRPAGASARRRPRPPGRTTARPWTIWKTGCTRWSPRSCRRPSTPDGAMPSPTAPPHRGSARSRPGSSCAAPRSGPVRRPGRPRGCGAPRSRSASTGPGWPPPPAAVPPARRSPPGWSRSPAGWRPRLETSLAHAAHRREHAIARRTEADAALAAAHARAVELQGNGTR